MLLLVTWVSASGRGRRVLGSFAPVSTLDMSWASGPQESGFFSIPAHSSHGTQTPP